MQNIPRHLKRLDDMLASLPADSEVMLVSEIDGFLAGVLVCPDLIMPGEWLPLVLGSGEEDAAPVFEDVEHAEQFLEVLMEHYNAIADGLRSGRYAPVLEVDARQDEILWELWIGGFEAAMWLRPDSFAAILEGDEETRAGLSGLLLLIDIAYGRSNLPEQEVQELTEQVPDLIRTCIEMLNARRLSQHAPNRPEVPVRALKVGRNDPCLCGSGKKYKKCCGVN
jgi:uncharacterized protein